MVNNYTKAYKEVREVLKHISEENIEKIPPEILETIESKMDKDYDFQYDENKSFEEQNLLIETKAILANLFRDYWATTEQKETIKTHQAMERTRNDELKREKYNPEDLFKKQNLNKNTECIQLTERKKESFIKRIIGILKNILYSKK